MAVTMVAVTRESVTLSWEMHSDAVGYTIRRRHRLPNGDWVDVIRALVYEGLFCDVGLTPGTEYSYEFTAVLDETEEPPPPPPDAEAPAAPPPDPDEELLQQRVRIRTQPETEYPGVRAWFTDFVVPTFRRRIGSSAPARWCPEWPRHPEVLYALTELWHAYEAMRPDPRPAFPSKVRAEWLVVFAWPVLDRLTSPEGPMYDCSCDSDDDMVERHMEPPDAQVLPLPELLALP